MYVAKTRFSTEYSTGEYRAKECVIAQIWADQTDCIHDCTFITSIIRFSPPTASIDFLKTLVPPLQLRKAGKLAMKKGNRKKQVSPVLLSLCRLLLLLKSLYPVRHIQVSRIPHLMNKLNRNTSVFRLMSLSSASAWLFKMTITTCFLSTLFSSIKLCFIFASFKVITASVKHEQVHSYQYHDILVPCVGLSSASLTVLICEFGSELLRNCSCTYSFPCHQFI